MAQEIPFLVPASGLYRTEIEIKRSRFIASLSRADSESEARSFIAQIKKEYPTARHNCSAFLCLESGLAIARSSDDGEPAGTAGMPMLEVVKGSGVNNLAVVVTRYFGGIKLGTGGLVRAYSAAVQEVLAQTQKNQIKTLPTYELSLDYAEAGRLESFLETQNWQILERDWGEQVRLKIGVELADSAQVKKTLEIFLSRVVELVPGENLQVEMPLE